MKIENKSIKIIITRKEKDFIKNFMEEIISYNNFCPDTEITYQDIGDIITSIYWDEPLEHRDDIDIIIED